MTYANHLNCSHFPYVYVIGKTNDGCITLRLIPISWPRVPIPLIESDQYLQSFGLNVLNRSRRNIANITVFLLSWRVQHRIVIGLICYGQEHYKISLKFEFDRNIVTGMDIWTVNKN